MTLSSTADADEAILLQFQQDFESAKDREEILARYCKLHPHLAERFQGRADMGRMLDTACSGRPEPPPKQLGEFRIVRRLGGGGMGEIYLAEHERLGREVAVKVIRPDRASPVARDRFQREQRALARLHQTHVVPIYAAGEDGPVHYFAMPFIKGAALHHVIRTARDLETAQPHGKTPTLGKLAERAAESKHSPHGSSGGPSSGRPGEAGEGPPAAQAGRARHVNLTLSREYFRSVAAALADVAEALQGAHQTGILHRDVKPGNLMIDSRGHCWVIDFGLAGCLAGAATNGIEGDDRVLAAAPVTASAIAGTPQYMAPEQWTGGKLDARTDVWGLGATLYELLTLRRAFDGSGPEEIRKKVLSTPPPSPRERVKGLPKDLEAICLKALQKEPTRRYQTAREFADDLRRWLRGEPAKVGPMRWLRRAGWMVRQNKGLAAILAAMVLAVTGLAVGWGVAEKARANAAQREVLILETQKVRLTAREAGWSADAWELVRAAARIRADERLQREAAATLAGLDARTHKKFPHGASSVAWDRDGKRLLMGGLPGQVAQLWNRDTGQVIDSQHAGAGPVAFGEDGTPLQLVLHPRAQETLLLWDVARQQPVREFKLPATGVTDLAMTPEGTFVSAAVSLPGGKALVTVWETRSGKVVKKIDQSVSALALAPDGTLVAGGAENGQIRIWSLSHDEPIATLQADRMSVQSLAFGRDPLRRMGDRSAEQAWLLAAGSAGGGVTIWDLQSRRRRAVCQGSGWGVYALAFSPDGATLGSAGHPNGRLWDVATGQQLLGLPVGDWATDLAFSADGQKLASCNDHRSAPQHSQVLVFDLEPGRGLRTFRGLVGQIARIQFSPDDRLLAALSSNWHVAIWDLDKGRLLHLLEVPKGLTADNAALVFDARGTRLAFASGTQAKLWAVGSGEELDSWDLPAGLVDRLAFRPDGQLLLFRVETRDNRKDFRRNGQPLVCRIRNLPSRKPPELVKEIEEFNGGVLNAAMPADGSYIVVEGRGGPGGNRHAIKVYEGPTGKELGTLPASRTKPAPALLVLDPPGKVLAFQPTDRQDFVLMDVPAQKLIGTLEWAPGLLSPGAELWGRGNGDGSYSLIRRKDEAALVTFDTGTVSSFGPFTAAGTRCSWGHTDGSVTVCDLNEVQRRLAEIGLGW
jgi:eukaryotic-like serine/threonine-protein kinase